jgi:hypothetical protein
MITDCCCTRGGIETAQRNVATFLRRFFFDDSAHEDASAAVIACDYREAITPGSVSDEAIHLRGSSLLGRGLLRWRSQ